MAVIEEKSKIQVFVPAPIWEQTKIAAIREKRNPRDIVAAALSAYLCLNGEVCPGDEEEETHA